MQRSFSIVHDDEAFEDDHSESKRFELKTEFSDSDPEELISNVSPKKLPPPPPLQKPEALPRRKSSVGPSDLPGDSKSDSDESEAEKKEKKLSGEYDPAQFAHLQVVPEIAEVFEYIVRYSPPKMTAEYKFKPFIPEFLPAVGDIDAFLKVVPPDTTLSGEDFDESTLHLGFMVLDEPASNQSDPALLHLQLRAASDNPMTNQEQNNIVVKKVDNIEKNSKVIDKWIKDISHLHKSKSSPIVRYSQTMPELDDLMQQWPEDLEQRFKKQGFPKPQDGASLNDYVDEMCNYLGIPIAKNKIQSLHLLFCLYEAIRQTQMYHQGQTGGYNKKENEKKSKDEEEDKLEADQLVLE